jgi:HK97 family phage portal protein
MGVRSRMAERRKRRAGKSIVVDGLPVVSFSPDISSVMRSYGAWGSYAEIYRHQPNVRTVVDFLARNVGQLTIKLYERVSATDRVHLDEHPASVILRKPNPGLTPYRLWEGTVADIGIYNRAYWRKLRAAGPGSRMVGVARVSPLSLLPDWDPATGQLRAYRMATGEMVRPDEFILFPGYDPLGGEGLSPLETLRSLLMEEFEAQVARRWFWRNFARKGGVVERPVEAPEWDDVARARWREDFEGRHTGAENTGRVAMLEDGMHWVDAQFSAEESQFIQSRKLLREEVASAYHIPPPMIGILDHGTYANVQESHKQLYQDTMQPLLDRLEQELALQLLPEFEAFDAQGRQYLEFNIEDKLKGSFEDRSKIAVQAGGGPYLTRNEVRAEFNRPRIDKPEYDELIVPANVVLGGQPSPVTPTATPATPQNVPKALGPDGAKAADAAEVEFLKEGRDTYTARHLEALQKTFRRQRNSVLGGKGFDRLRWDKELADDLFGVAVQATTHFGEHAAERVKGAWDQERTANYLRANADGVAKSINDVTDTQLGEEGADAAAVFQVLIDARAPQIAATRTTFVMNWAANEAVHQNSPNDGK